MIKIKREPFVGHKHPETSQAMQTAVLSRPNTWAQKVYAYIESTGDMGATDYELQEAFNRTNQTIGPSRGQLVKRGLVMDSGKRRTTGSGNRAIVWITTQGDTHA